VIGLREVPVSRRPALLLPPDPRTLDRGCRWRRGLPQGCHSKQDSTRGGAWIVGPKVSHLSLFSGPRGVPPRVQCPTSTVLEKFRSPPPSPASRLLRTRHLMCSQEEPRSTKPLSSPGRPAPSRSGHPRLRRLRRLRAPSVPRPLHMPSPFSAARPPYHLPPPPS
jgi:hypothetical protein